MGDTVHQTVDAILTAILQWRVDWLEEQKTHNEPPPICRCEPRKLKITYSDYKDYESTFVPLIMHEIWAQIFDEWIRVYNNGTILMESDDPIPPQQLTKGTSIPREFHIGVVEYKSDTQFQCKLRCQAVVEAHKLASHLKMISEGDLVKLDLVVEPEAHQHASSSSRKSETVVDTVRKQSILSLFAYCIDVSAEKIGQYTVLSDCFQSRKSQFRSFHVINYHLVIAKRPLRLRLMEFMRLTGLYYLKPMIRQIESVANLRESALAPDILNPRIATCHLALPTVVDLKSSTYNDAQYRAIVGSNEALSRSMPKIQLIQGPPGTGKTHTLVGVIKYFYSNWRETPGKVPRILICTPSNGAIDEVARRLYKEREFLKQTRIGRSLRMVRVGHPDQVSDSVKNISLDFLVETNATKKVDFVRKRQSAKMSEIEEEIMKMDTKISNLRAENRQREIPGIEMKIGELRKEYEQCRVQDDLKSRREGSEAAKRNMRYDLIRNADIILTTLNSCQRHPLDVIFKKHSSELQFHCVIVDEASQCTEPEVLMPLCYNISKFILIGDPMQLPATVISRRAQDYGYSRSLFERFFTHFGQYSSTSPVSMLTEQYRMHPAICWFPSKQFYDKRLITSRPILDDYPIKPYVLFDLRHGSEKKTSEKTIENEAEAEFIRRLLTAVVRIAPTGSKIGVITPYKGQKKLITRKIHEMKSERKITIDVDTCDGFQGQEKDIIILSCVRSSKSIGFLKSFQRMNVALTRAKQSLLVCISIKSLKNDQMWASLIDDAMNRRAVQSYTQTPSIVMLEKMIEHDGSFVLEYSDSSQETTGKGLISDVGNFDPEYTIPMEIDVD